MVNCYSLLEYDDPMRLLAGKPESLNAGMLREYRALELPSFPEANSYNHKIRSVIPPEWAGPLSFKPTKQITPIWVLTQIGYNLINCI